MRILTTSIVLFLFGCGECDLVDVEERTRQLAGDGATNCGSAEGGASIESPRACMMAAFEAGQAAYAVLEVSEVGEPLALGWALTADGIVFRLDLDSDPPGEGDANLAVTAARCDNPRPQSGAQNPSFFACRSETLQAQVCG